MFRPRPTPTVAPDCKTPHWWVSAPHAHLPARARGSCCTCGPGLKPLSPRAPCTCREATCYHHDIPTFEGGSPPPVLGALRVLGAVPLSLCLSSSVDFLQQGKSISVLFAMKTLPVSFPIFRRSQMRCPFLVLTSFPRGGPSLPSEPDTPS